MNYTNKILLCFSLIFSLSSYSEIAEVYRWKANPGEGASMIETMVEAASIQREMGAHVTINQLDVGSQNQALKSPKRPPRNSREAPRRPKLSGTSGLSLLRNVSGPGTSDLAR